MTRRVCAPRREEKLTRDAVAQRDKSGAARRYNLAALFYFYGFYCYFWGRAIVWLGRLARVENFALADDCPGAIGNVKADAADAAVVDGEGAGLV